MDWPVSFGGNLELDYMRHAAEDQPLTLEMRPIAETRLGPFEIVGEPALRETFLRARHP